MKDSIRLILGLIILFILLRYAIICVSYFISTPQHIYYKDCGVIKSKSTDEVAIKHGTSTELYLNVQFEKTGFIAMEVGPTTYFKFQKGNKVCFDLEDEKTKNNKHVIKHMAGLIILIIGGIVLLCYFIGWVFNIKIE